LDLDLPAACPKSQSGLSTNRPDYLDYLNKHRGNIYLHISVGQARRDYLSPLYLLAVPFLEY
jgi:hypothetical protein